MRLGTYPLGNMGLRVSDLARARRFYVDTLGFLLARESPVAVFIDAHGLPVALLGPGEQTSAADRFDPFRVGLDHLAVAIADAGELDGLREQLDAAGVPNHGIERDGTAYISFYDPQRHRLGVVCPATTVAAEAPSYGCCPRRDRVSCRPVAQVATRELVPHLLDGA